MTNPIERGTMLKVRYLYQELKSSHAPCVRIFGAIILVVVVSLLVFNPLQKFVWFGTAFLFAIFFTVSFLKGIFGETSCGCFGSVDVNPFITAIFDAAIVGLLQVFRKFQVQKAGNFVRKCVIAVLAWLAISVPLLFAINSVQKNDLSLLGTEFIGADGKKTILLEPEKWVKSEPEARVNAFPLLPYIETPDVREKLKTGSWIVVLYHHDCPKCRELIEKLASEDAPNVVCIEVPPYGVGHELPKHFVSGKLTDRLSWFVQTPYNFVGSFK
ncbi:MAG: hypothetical protein ACRC2T_19870 [Thermoguttaceae bacterium]